MKYLAILLTLLWPLSGASAQSIHVTASASALQMVDPATFTVLKLDRTNIDTSSFHADTANPSRLLIPADGTYRVDANTLAGATSAQCLVFWLLKNGTTYLKDDIEAGNSPSVSTSMRLEWEGPLHQGDYLELVFYHTAAGPLSVGASIPFRNTTVTIRQVEAGYPNLWVLSGQSNGVKLQPALSVVAVNRQRALAASGFNAMPIGYWDVGQPGWDGLQPVLQQRVDAFIWFQGEANEGSAVGVYRASLAAFISRVRVTVGNPTLPVYICQIGAYEQPPIIVPEQIAYVASDPYAHLINTSGMDWIGGYPGSIHMSTLGYQQLAAAISAAIP